MLDRLLHLVTGSPAFQFLRSVAPFDALPDNELAAIADQLGIEYHARGAALFTQGQSQVKDLYVVMKGSLEVVDEQSGATPYRGTLGVGQTFGGSCLLLNGGVALLSAKAAQDVFLYTLAGRAFLDLCSRRREIHDFFADSLGAGMLERVGIALRQRWLVPRADPSSVAFNRRVGEVCARACPRCSPADSLRDAAQRMQRERCRTLLVTDEAGLPMGMLGERDLMEKVVAGGLDPLSSVAGVMTPVTAVLGEQAPIAEAMDLMLRSGARALPVVDGRGQAAGLLEDEHLLTAPGGSPMEFLRELSATRLRKDLLEKRWGVVRLVRSLMLEGVRVDALGWLVSAVSDAVVRRLLDLALEELGPPPCPFAFLSLGSEGRREQTLVSDQDSAIVFADGAPAGAQAYFLSLGERVCAWLRQGGVAYCQGDVMASNPRWTQPLSAWKKDFAHWVHVPESQAALHSGIFFDFREVYGEAALATQLREHVAGLLAPRPGLFFRVIAQEAISRGLPSGNAALELKQPLAAICDLARLFALWEGVRETNTLERLRELLAAPEPGRKTCEDLRQAHSFLLQVRLARQVAGATVNGAEGAAGRGEINPLERRFLDETLGLIRRVQGQAQRLFVRGE
ncbi:MAG: CBS domain-containing protein [Deltaproteobacteria bacterium]|nr:CBS domain-containing protein [Deltaproteobacteria bacterium]